MCNNMLFYTCVYVLPQLLYVPEGIEAVVIFCDYSTFVAVVPCSQGDGFVFTPSVVSQTTRYELLLLLLLLLGYVPRTIKSRKNGFTAYFVDKDTRPCGRGCP